MRRPVRLSPVRAAAALLPLALLGAGLVGCFSESPEPTGPSAPETATVTGSETANVFSPATVTITQGGTVTWSVGTRPHNVTFATTAGAPANVPTGTNFEVSRQFPTAGTFAYQCTLHSGMAGTVVVQP